MSKNTDVVKGTVYPGFTKTLLEDNKPVTVTFSNEAIGGLTLSNIISSVPAPKNGANNPSKEQKTETYAQEPPPQTSQEESPATSTVTEPEVPFTTGPTAADTVIDTSAVDSSTSGPTAIPTETTEPFSGRLPDGAIAGIAIGCLVAGLALGIIVAFILFRRRQKRNHPPASFIKAEQPSPELKGGPQVTVTTSRNEDDLGQFLLETTPDKDIQGELRSLSELIYQHVENHYHGLQVQVDPAEVAQSLVNIGYSPELSGLQVDTVAAVCLAPKTRQVGLRHVISHIIFQSLDFSSASSFSMLPLAATALSPTSHSAENANSLAISLARSKWRSLTALLLHPTPNERTPLPVSVAEASPRAQFLANELNTVLQLFVAQDSASRQEQASHLQAVILECTQLGYVVLSQPSDWRFVFSSSSTYTKSRRIMVCPGLEKLSHNDGTRYGSPKEVVPPETTPL